MHTHSKINNSLSWLIGGAQGSVNMLVSFDTETLLRHAGAVTKDGGIIYDSELVGKNIGEVPTLDDAFRDRLINLLERKGKSLTVQGILNYASENGAIPQFLNVIITTIAWNV